MIETTYRTAERYYVDLGSRINQIEAIRVAPPACQDLRNLAHRAALELQNDLLSALNSGQELVLLRLDPAEGIQELDYAIRSLTNCLITERSAVGGGESPF